MKQTTDKLQVENSQQQKRLPQAVAAAIDHDYILEVSDDHAHEQYDLRGLKNLDIRIVARFDNTESPFDLTGQTAQFLEGIRVEDLNVVHIIGLEPPTTKDESSLKELLRGDDFFGQHGPIAKIVVRKPKPGAINQGFDVYVAFRNKEDAANCIKRFDGSVNGGRILR